MQDDNKEGYGVMIAKKSERLVTALYIVTDLIDADEPIKNSLRKNSVSLLSSMNALMQYDVKDRTTEFALSLKATMEIISLLHVAAATGLVSEMNGKLLIEGFRVLQSVLEKRQPVLTKEMISVDFEETMFEKAESYSGIVSTSYDALTLGEMSRSEKGAKETSPATVQVKGHSEQTHKGQEGQKNKTSPSQSILAERVVRPSPTLASSFQTRKQTRREQVVSLFVRGVDVSIKDIAARIRGCSEKTIQRELNSLVYDNIIERIGEKRWSRYILR